MTRFSEMVRGGFELVSDLPSAAVKMVLHVIDRDLEGEITFWEFIPHGALSKMTGPVRVVVFND